jgi:hypothetical protein
MSNSSKRPGDGYFLLSYFFFIFHYSRAVCYTFCFVFPNPFATVACPRPSVQSSVENETANDRRLYVSIVIDVWNTAYIHNNDNGLRFPYCYRHDSRSTINKRTRRHSCTRITCPAIYFVDTLCVTIGVRGICTVRAHTRSPRIIHHRRLMRTCDFRRAADLLRSRVVHISKGRLRNGSELMFKAQTRITRL